MRSINSIVVVAMVLSVGVFAMVSTGNATEITIKAGTPVPVRIDETVSSESATAGQTVRCFVTRDVFVDDFIVIKAGTEVVAEVTYSQKTGSLGKEGKVFLVVRNTVAVDNTIVPLRANLSQTGDEKVALSWMVCPFIKGTQSMIPSGTETKAYVDYDTILKIKD
ncbi:MAG: hypothetical protein NUV86_08145 [Candidatus Scalindua sp.]|nr:hypothetical protein [Candidatus Scalindua sp.]